MVTVFCWARAVIADNKTANNSGGTRRFISGLFGLFLGLGGQAFVRH
jgi:hypothetical protein